MIDDIASAMRWARAAVQGDYLITYEDSGLTDDEDPGSRCGFDDAELAEIEAELRKRGLTLLADDVGLYAQEVAR